MSEETAKGPDIKMVIVIRRDYGGKGVRRGKEIAQGGHSAMEWILRRMASQDGITFEFKLKPEEVLWCMGAKKKIVLQVKTEEELRKIYQAAIDARLVVHLIEDLGMTEFHGTKTPTAIGIGPDFAHNIDPITGHLSPY